MHDDSENGCDPLDFLSSEQQSITPRAKRHTWRKSRFLYFLLIITTICGHAVLIGIALQLVGVVDVPVLSAIVPSLRAAQPAGGTRQLSTRDPQNIPGKPEEIPSGDARGFGEILGAHPASTARQDSSPPESKDAKSLFDMPRLMVRREDADEQATESGFGETAEQLPSNDPIGAELEAKQAEFEREHAELVKDLQKTLIKRKTLAEKKKSTKRDFDRAVDLLSRLENKQELPIEAMDKRERRHAYRLFSDLYADHLRARGRYAAAGNVERAIWVENRIEELLEKASKFLPSEILLGQLIAPELQAPQVPAAQIPRFPIENSNWKLKRVELTTGATVSGAFRVVNGMIYHLDQDHAVGSAMQHPNGLVELWFCGHRKMVGVAMISKIADGEWGGRAVMPGDSQHDFLITRTK
jgi:hypothetical protein